VIEWVPVEGGLLRYGDRGRTRIIPDLLWTKLPIHCDRYIAPATELNYFTAVEVAADHSARLPSSSEWEWMASSRGTFREYPWGDREWRTRDAVLNRSELDSCPNLRDTLATPTLQGVQHVGGGVWEWTNTKMLNRGRIIRGGSYRSRPVHARIKFINVAPEEVRSRGIGVRLVKQI